MQHHDGHLFWDFQLEKTIQRLLQQGVRGSHLRLEPLLQQLVDFPETPDPAAHLQVVGKMALFAGSHPYGFTAVCQLFSSQTGQKRLLLEAAVLQGLLDAHPFNRDHFDELLQVFTHLRFAISRMRLVDRVVPWGVQHAADALYAWLPALNCPEPEGEVWQDGAHLHRHLLGLEDPRVVPCLKSHLRILDWESREKVARRLLQLGWKPRTRTETAQYVVARRNPKAVVHLQDKMPTAIQVIPFLRQYTPVPFYGRYDRPDILYYLQVVQQLPALHDPWKLEQIIIHSKRYAVQAQVLKAQLNSP